MLCLPPATIHPQVNNPSDPQEVGTVDVVVSQQLGPYDVMCGRHKDAFNNIGNRRFRVTVSLAVPRYLAAHTRKDKSVVVKSIAAMVRSNGGRFLQRQHGVWVELDDYMAHDKVGHAMRDMVAKTTAVAATTTTTATTTVSTGAVSKSNDDSNDNNSNNLLPVLLSASAAKRKASAAQLVHRQKRQQVPSNNNNNNRMIELVSLMQHHPQPVSSPHDECPQQITLREEQDPADEEEEEEAFPHCEEVLKDELEYDEDCSLSGISFFSFDDCSEDVSGTFQETPLPPPSAASSSSLLSELDDDPTLFDLEPTPLLPEEGDNNRRSSVNDQMLSWLICESHTLFPGLDETMHRNLESANL